MIDDKTGRSEAQRYRRSHEERIRAIEELRAKLPRLRDDVREALRIELGERPESRAHGDFAKKVDDRKSKLRKAEQEIANLEAEAQVLFVDFVVPAERAENDALVDADLAAVEKLREAERTAVEQIVAGYMQMFEGFAEYRATVEAIYAVKDGRIVPAHRRADWNTGTEPAIVPGFRGLPDAFERVDDVARDPGGRGHHETTPGAFRVKPDQNDLLIKLVPDLRQNARRWRQPTRQGDQRSIAQAQAVASGPPEDA